MILRKKKKFSIHFKMTTCEVFCFNKYQFSKQGFLIKIEKILQFFS